MSNYYYLVASLPMLLFEKDPVISIREFKEICSHLLKDQDFLIVRDALLNSFSKRWVSNPIVARWQEVEFDLRNEIARLRAQKKGLDPKQNLHHGLSNLSLAGKAREIFETENPLEGEMIFNRTLWDVCDELEIGWMFNLEFLIIYHFRLQILDRIKSFIPEKGRQKVESIITGEVSDE